MPIDIAALVVAGLAKGGAAHVAHGAAAKVGLGKVAAAAGHAHQAKGAYDVVKGKGKEKGGRAAKWAGEQVGENW